MSCWLFDPMKEALDREFSAKVKHALDQLVLGKSPGPDGLSVTFYRNHWDVVGLEVTDTILGFLNLGLPMDNLNTADLIVLIPKKESRNPFGF